MIDLPPGKTLPDDMPKPDKPIRDMTADELLDYVHLALDRCDELKVPPPKDPAASAKLLGTINLLLDLVTQIAIFKLHALDERVRQVLQTGALVHLTEQVRAASTQQAALTKGINELRDWVNLISHLLSSVFAVIA